MDGKAIIAGLTNVVNTLKPVIPGLANAAAVVKGVTDLVATTKATFSHEDTAPLETSAAELQALVDKVNAHADDTIESLSARHQEDTASRSGH